MAAICVFVVTRLIGMDHPPLLHSSAAASKLYACLSSKHKVDVTTLIDQSVFTELALLAAFFEVFRVPLETSLSLVILAPVEIYDCSTGAPLCNSVLNG